VTWLLPSFFSLFWWGFEPGIFCSWGGRDDHYATPPYVCTFIKNTFFSNIIHYNQKQNYDLTEVSIVGFAADFLYNFKISKSQNRNLIASPDAFNCLARMTGQKLGGSDFEWNLDWAVAIRASSEISIARTLHRVTRLGKFSPKRVVVYFGWAVSKNL
jgi:hypothetical protein